MTITRTPQAAAIYTRISLDKAGEGLGVARQETLCRKLAKAKGWPVVAVYTDESISAFSKKPRPQFQRLLADVEAGQVDAIVVVDTDRLVRRPMELEGLMETFDARGVLLANVSGNIDLSTTDGRLIARIVGAVAAQESERKSDRQQREAEQAARRGLPRGSRRPFGWEKGGVTLNPVEAEVVRQAVATVLAGGTCGDVARDLNVRGIPSPQHGRYGWNSQTIRNVLRNPRLCGQRTYRGEVVAQGQWEPILDRATWEQLQGRLRRGPSPGRPGSHLLSGIVRCGRCGGPLWASHKSASDGRTLRYACGRGPGTGGCGRLTITAEPLDELIRDAVVHALAGPNLAKARALLAGKDQDKRKAAKALADAESRRDEAAGMFSTGELSRREWSTVRETTAKLIADAERVLSRGNGALVGLPANEDALRAAWESHPVAWRRSLLNAVVESITVRPGQPGKAFNPDRVQLTWRV